MRKLNLFFIGIIVVSLAASVLMEWRIRAGYRDNETLSRQQDQQLAGLAAENQRLSNLIAQAKTNRAPAEDRTVELAQLRAKVGALREQTNQLAQWAREVAENRRLEGARFYAAGDSNLLEHNHEKGITFAGGPRASSEINDAIPKINDAIALAGALRRYADDHQGDFPMNLNLVTSYLHKPLDADSPSLANAPLTGTNDFEIVFQGSQNDLTNIPKRRVALLRERQPWMTPNGNWARVYAYADGAASTVESDDNFQSWDAQHVIPPQADGQ